MKNDFQIINGVKIYPFKYLSEEELIDSDLNYLFETNSLLYSIIIEMYKFVKSHKKPIDIINNIQKDNKWLSKNTWTNSERTKFEEKLKNVLKNIYYISDNTALQKAQWYMMIYGFDIK